MKMLLGKDWTAVCERPGSPKGYGLFSLEGTFLVEYADDLKLEDHMDYSIGLCLERSRSKSIVLCCLLLRVDILIKDQETTDECYVEWVSTEKFDPVPRNNVLSGKECRIFIND